MTAYYVLISQGRRVEVRGLSVARHNLGYYKTQLVRWTTRRALKSHMKSPGTCNSPMFAPTNCP